MAAKDELGRAGEDRAVAYLQDQGYEILARNWRAPTGEIDVIARTGRQLVFVEVKTRRGGDFGDPLEAVDARKRARLWRLAHAWLERNPDLSEGWAFRLDVIGITGLDPAVARLDHLTDAPWV